MLRWVVEGLPLITEKAKYVTLSDRVLYLFEYSEIMAGQYYPRGPRNFFVFIIKA